MATRKKVSNGPELTSRTRTSVDLGAVAINVTQPLTREPISLRDVGKKSTRFFFQIETLEVHFTTNVVLDLALLHQC